MRGWELLPEGWILAAPRRPWVAQLEPWVAASWLEGGARPADWRAATTLLVWRLAPSAPLK